MFAVFGDCVYCRWCGLVLRLARLLLSVFACWHSPFYHVAAVLCVVAVAIAVVRTEVAVNRRGVVDTCMSMLSVLTILLSDIVFLKGQSVAGAAVWAGRWINTQVIGQLRQSYVSVCCW